MINLQSAIQAHKLEGEIKTKDAHVHMHTLQACDTRVHTIHKTTTHLRMHTTHVLAHMRTFTNPHTHAHTYIENDNECNNGEKESNELQFEMDFQPAILKRTSLVNQEWRFTWYML